MTIKLHPRKNPKLLKNRDCWDVSLSASLPVWLVLVPGFKTSVGWAQRMRWNGSKSHKSIPSGQCQNTPMQCAWVFWVDVFFFARKRSQGQHNGDSQEVVNKSKSGNTGALMSRHLPAKLTVTWPPESSQYLQPLLELGKKEHGQGSFPLALALPHRPKSPEWGCIMVLLNNLKVIWDCNVY